MQPPGTLRRLIGEDIEHLAVCGSALWSVLVQFPRKAYREKFYSKNGSLRSFPLLMDMNIMEYVQFLKTESALKPKINASFDYHNIGWNEWTSQNNYFELDLHIDTSER